MSKFSFFSFKETFKGKNKIKKKINRIFNSCNN